MDPDDERRRLIDRKNEIVEKIQRQKRQVEAQTQNEVKRGENLENQCSEFKRIPPKSDKCCGCCTIL